MYKLLAVYDSDILYASVLWSISINVIGRTLRPYCSLRKALLEFLKISQLKFFYGEEDFPIKLR